MLIASETSLICLLSAYLKHAKLIQHSLTCTLFLNDLLIPHIYFPGGQKSIGAQI